MSRSEYNDDCDDHWSLICWRGAVNSAIKGRRGQAFLREMLAAFDALEAKRLIAHDFIKDGEVCAIGSVGAARGIDMSAIDPYDHSSIASTFGIAEAMVREIEFMNDEWVSDRERPEARFSRMRQWVATLIGQA